MKRNTYFISIVIVCLILAACIYGIEQQWPAFSFNVLMTGNVLMAILSFLSFVIVRKQMHDRPQAFVRGVYSATFLKLMVCMAALLIYVLIDRKNIHKPSLFVLFGIYAAYTAVETIFLQHVAREPK